MKIDKLYPAPWKPSKDAYGVLRIWDSEGNDVASCCGDGSISREDEENHADFICLARQALDVMMKRKWQPRFMGIVNGRCEWTAFSWRTQRNVADMSDMLQSWPENKLVFDDPFTAIVEADRWMKERESGV